MSKKEALVRFHREHILDAARELFSVKGLDGTSVDEIAAKAEYSKSTVYVYFSGKEDIYYHLVYGYMTMLRQGIADCMIATDRFEKRYFAICDLLTDFADRDRLYFDSMLGSISVDEADFERLPVLRSIYDTGEEINALVSRLFRMPSKAVLQTKVFPRCRRALCFGPASAA
jgi:AcrR family transcriptional regulator